MSKKSGRDAGAGTSVAGAEAAARNEVLLVGRVSSAPERRTLPSGDVLLTWRIVVERPPRARPAGSRVATVDALDCVAWAAGIRRTAGSWVVGDVVQLEGALRRRFWRSAGGAASRWEVEVVGGRRLRRAA